MLSKHVQRGGGGVACGDGAVRSALSEASGRCEVAGRVSQHLGAAWRAELLLSSCRIFPTNLPVVPLRSRRVDLTSGEKKKNLAVFCSSCLVAGVRGMGVGVGWGGLLRSAHALPRRLRAAASIINLFSISSPRVHRLQEPPPLPPPVQLRSISISMFPPFCRWRFEPMG